MATLRTRAERIPVPLGWPTRPDGEAAEPASPRRRWARPWAPGRGGARRRPPLVVWLPALVVAAAVLLPVVYLGLRASEAGTGVWDLILRPRTALVLRQTAALAGGVAAGGVVLAVPLAWLTTRTDLPGRRLWATAAALPLVVPSYVGALAIVAALGPKGLLQTALEPLGVDRLPPVYGFFGAWLTLTLFTYPYVYLSVRAALRGLDSAL